MTTMRAGSADPIEDRQHAGCVSTTLPPRRSECRSHQVFSQQMFGWAFPACAPIVCAV